MSSKPLGTNRFPAASNDVKPNPDQEHPNDANAGKSVTKRRNDKRYLLKFVYAFRKTFSQPVKLVCYPYISHTETEVLTFDADPNFGSF
jgi:hypothetical protein